ncbi:MAG TPA: hypothetical protein VMG59_11080 [Phycisphaerae bacterium]|nr:hypothetical protein [Phycisphaerae bacterium]
MSSKQLLIGALVLINIMLAAMLVSRIGLQTPAARAQGYNGGGGQYAVASGSSMNGGIVYILDENAGVISGLVTSYNSSSPKYIIPRNIAMDISRASKRTP